MDPRPDRPIRLRPDNFTPPSRTPWGGRRIVSVLKRGLSVEEGARVGESWELSVEPDFPCHLEAGGTLADAIARDPAAFVGVDHASRWGSTPLLVKLLDAADALSVQIHPPDDAPDLAPDESGKPEAWYVLEASAGAGIYLGLADDATEARVRSCVQAGGDLSELLTFVPVEVGDVFQIEPGTPHAIGPGLTLLEPQRVLPGRRGVTLRYWDWNRRYDAAGLLDPRGQPRPLHLERALAMTRWDAPRGSALLDRVRRRHGAPDLSANPLRVDLLAGVPGAVLGMERMAGTGPLHLPPMPVMRAATVVAGEVEVEVRGEVTSARCGESLALPASLPDSTWSLARATVLLSWVRLEG